MLIQGFTPPGVQRLVRSSVLASLERAEFSLFQRGSDNRPSVVVTDSMTGGRTMDLDRSCQFRSFSFSLINRGRARAGRYVV